MGTQKEEGACATCKKKDTYNMPFKDYPDIVSISQLSQMLQICEKTAYKLLKNNEIGHFKIGRAYKIPKLNVINYMAANCGTELIYTAREHESFLTCRHK